MSFSLTRKTDYALVALAVLAEEAGGDGGPLSARQIAEAHGLPVALLMNVLKELHRAEIVCSRRGAGGGYILCHRPEELTLLRVLEALEGPVQVALCCEDERVEAAGGEPCVACRVMDKCPITLPMQRFGGLVRDFLGGVTLRDLIAEGAEGMEKRGRAVAGGTAAEAAGQMGEREVTGQMEED